MKKIIFSFLLIINTVFVVAQTNPDKKVVYKNIDSTELSLHFFFPEGHSSSDQSSAIVFFHGGGWKGGSPGHFYNQSKYLASRGMVAISVQYRTEKANNTSPAECVKDGKSAIRWIRSHSAEYGINSKKIAAGGGSAGGNIAAATAVLKGFNESSDDLTVSCKPNALVLFNPVANNGPEGYGYDRVKEYWKDFSPYHNLKKGTSPTLIMLGTKDKLFTPDQAKQYKQKMEVFGDRCDLILYEGQDHAFFNLDINEEMHFQTMKDTDIFLTSLGYLKGAPTVDDFRKNTKSKQYRQPNLIIIHTDEHNLRTIGAYRNTMTDEQAFMWGKDAVVTTPNIDALAKDGVLCTNWYASSPVCTPSRASMVSGLYPIATGSPVNDMPLNDDVVTFAQILKEKGYATSYVGKWHLDGDDKPGIHPDRSFGFTDNRYMINRGHWKVLGENEEGLYVDQKLSSYGGGQWEPKKANEETFTTDFLTDRTIEIIERDSNKPFCVMLSFPDPHGPNQVRAPYDTMYSNIKFEDPRTMYPTPEQTPGWLNIRGKKNSGKKVKQQAMAQYFGMVKCIDDNVGRILNHLKENNLEENTIVVFTSDHGDLLYEHQKLNKGNPYEMSARVAFIIRYPKKINAERTIQKAYTMVDFAPTILGLMDIDHSEYKFHGIDASKDFKSKKKKIIDDRTVYITNANNRWVAAVNNRYKLVLSPKDKPWLFDLEKDPDELINFYNKPEYSKIAEELQKELYDQMDKYGEPLKKKAILK